ncbi:hypothetical protein SAMN05720354_11286 [Nitrosospira sp. Nsp1]|nr:hypothetical protein SAMN05720354_11286 [Nitrosospira sp. Nsp1]
MGALGIGAFRENTTSAAPTAEPRQHWYGAGTHLRSEHGITDGKELR